MRILNKIQPILESNLDFQGFINIAPTHPNPEVQPMVEFRVGFMQVTEHRQIFLQDRHIFVYARKQRPYSTTGCIML